MLSLAWLRAGLPTGLSGLASPMQDSLSLSLSLSACTPPHRRLTAAGCHSRPRLCHPSTWSVNGGTRWWPQRARGHSASLRNTWPSIMRLVAAGGRLQAPDCSTPRPLIGVSDPAGSSSTIAALRFPAPHHSMCLSRKRAPCWTLANLAYLECRVSLRHLTSLGGLAYHRDR